jgi:hypothetical protein
MTWNQAGGAAASPAFSLPNAMTHRVLACLGLLLLGVLSVAQGAVAKQSGYRLAGVLAAGDSYLGFLELPDGDQMLVRLGSPVNGGQVVRFDARSLIIRFPDGVVVLSLEGSRNPAPVAIPASQNVVVSGDEQGHVIRREVDVDELQAGLEDADRVARSAAPRTSGAAPSAQQAVTKRIAPLLDLPADARVIAVNETRIRSADAALKLVETTLAQGMPARLNLETPSGMKRVYLMPARPPTPGTP